MKKNISILLVLCMLFTMLPMGMTVVSATTTTVEQSVADPATETEDVIEISTLQSEITLTFTPAVADASAVTFTTADGTAIKGAVVGTAGTVEGGSTYTLKFGRLEKDVEYKLTVPTSVTGNGAATVYTYKASIDGTKVDVNTEFTGEGFTLDAAPTDTRTSTAKTGLRYHYGDQRYDFSASANYNSAQNMKVIADGTDDQALELAPLKVTAEDEAVTYYGAELSVNASAQFKNIAAGDRDVYVIDTAVKAYADGEDAEVATPERRVFMPTRTDFSHGGGLGVFEVGNILKLQRLATSANNGVELGAGESWKKVRAVIRDNGTLGYYNTTPVKPKTIDGATTDGTGLTPHQRVDLYDVTGAVPKYIDENATVTAEDYAYRIAQIVKPTSDDGLNSRMAVDYVYARKDKAMTVLKTDGYTKANKSVVFHMSDDIDAETVNTITVADANGEAVDGFIATVDAENRTITVSFPYGLGIAGTESSYTVDLGGVIGTNGVAVWNGKYVWNNEYTGTDKNGYVHQNLATQSITVATEEAGTLARVAESSIANGATDVSVHVGTASVTYGVALDDKTLDGITLVSVVDGEEAAISGEVTKTLSDDKKTITFTFGRLDAGLHRIKVDGTTLNTADGEIVVTEAIEFTTVNTYASIASSTPAANAADVSVHVGEASVTYGFALKPDTLDGITLVSAVDGEEVALRGKVTKTFSDDGKTVTFKFGRLDAGLHRIKVDGAVLEAAGGEIVSTESIEFTTVDTEQTKLDFTTAEGFTAGSAIPDGKGILNASANGVSVVADGDTDNAVRVQPGEGTAGGYKAFNLIYDFSGGKLTGTAAKGAYLANGLEATTLTDVRDVYVVETALKASTPITHTNSDIRIMNGAYNASTTPPLTSTTESAVIAYTKYLLNGSDATIPAEADGWTKVRAVLRADGRYHGKYEAAWKDTAIKAPTESSIAPVVATDVYGASSAGAQFIGTAKGGTYNAVGINIAGFTLYDNNADFKQNYIDVDYIYTKKEKAMTVFDSDLGYTKADKKIVFYMTDDIDETSADRVVVKSGEKVIGDREVTVNNADRSITVKFAGLAAGSYTVDISKVLGTNGVAVYNGLYKWDTDAAAYSHENLATASFTVSETEGSFAVDSVTSGETAISDTIDADANEITITFAGTLADGAADAITFTKEGEDRIAGKLIKTQDGATVTLNFGRLEEGAKYILTIPDTVKNVGGAAVDAKTYTLTVTREYEIKRDFSGMAEDGDTEIYNNDNGWKGSQSASSILAMSTGYNADLSTDEFGVVFDGIVTAKKNGEDTYLEMKPYSSTQTSSRTGAYLVPKKANGVATTFVGKYFNSEGTTYEGKDGYVLAMDARVNTQAIDPEATTMHLTSVFSIYDQPIAKFQGSGERGTLKSFYNGTGINLSPAYEFNAVAENEYNSARMVLSAKTRPAVYTEVEYKLYDLDNGTYVGKQANKTNYSYPIYSDIAVQTVSEAWNPGSSNVAINLTDFAVFYAKAMSVLNTQLDTEDYVVTIAMTDEIDEATLGNLAITLDETAVNPATYDVGYNEEERTIEITFLYGLKTGVYNVSLAGVEPKNGLADGTAATSFEVEEGSAVYMANFAFEGSVDGGEFLELVSGEAGEGQISIGDADAIKVSAEIGGVDDPAVFLAVYDEDYNLVDVVKINYNADEDAYTATLDELPTNTVKHASMYVWRSLDTLAPLFKPLQCL